MWYLKVHHAIDYARHGSRSRHAVIRVYDETGNVIETHKLAGEFKESAARLAQVCGET
jgi:hypothetical protein